MKKSKILININEISEYDDYKEIGITNFLFAVQGFSIGYIAFNLDDIPDDVYVLLNRIMDTTAIDSLKKVKDKFKRFRGIIFEDLGVFHIFKDMNIPLVWFQNHFATNYNSINYYLNNGCISAIVSNELSKSEIEEILVKSNKPLILNVFGKNNIMYSRRRLLSNYNEYMGLKNYNDVVLSTADTKFFARENEFGTMIFSNDYFNYLEFAGTINDDAIYLYLIMNLDLTVKEITKVINGTKIGNDGFLNKKTVYKLSDYDKKE